MDERTNGCYVDEWVCERPAFWANKWTDGFLDTYLDGWSNVMDGWAAGRLGE